MSTHPPTLYDEVALAICPSFLRFTWSSLPAPLVPALVMTFPARLRSAEPQIAVCTMPVSLSVQEPINGSLHSFGQKR